MGELDGYRRILADLPGVKSYQLDMAPRGAPDWGFDGRLRLHTEAGSRDFLVQLFQSHLTRRTADHIAAVAAGRAEPMVLLGPHIGAGLAAKLSEAGVNYIDKRGNCHIVAPPLFVHIEGKSAGRWAPVGKGLRRAGYQVLFAYLAEPSLLDAPVRTVAELAGASRQAVSDMRHRLLDEAYVVATKARVRWIPRRRLDGLSLWLHGYETTVRSSLLWGTYRTQDASPADLERRLTQLVTNRDLAELRWGGSAAGFRLTGHYRGERTVVHVHATPGDFRQRLRAITDPRGNLVVMNAFGTLSWQGDRGTVHPLLVYSEMLNEGSERAREAAEDLFEKHLRPKWEHNS